MDKRSFLLDLLNASNLLQRSRPEEDQLILVFVETKKGMYNIVFTSFVDNKAIISTIFVEDIIRILQNQGQTITVLTVSQINKYMKSDYIWRSTKPDLI